MRGFPLGEKVGEGAFARRSHAWAPGQVVEAVSRPKHSWAGRPGTRGRAMNPAAAFPPPGRPRRRRLFRPGGTLDGALRAIVLTRLDGPDPCLQLSRDRRPLTTRAGWATILATLCHRSFHKTAPRRRGVALPARPGWDVGLLRGSGGHAFRGNIAHWHPHP